MIPERYSLYVIVQVPKIPSSLSGATTKKNFKCVPWKVEESLGEENSYWVFGQCIHACIH